jgi:hypothetical protein
MLKHTEFLIPHLVYKRTAFLPTISGNSRVGIRDWDTWATVEFSSYFEAAFSAIQNNCDDSIQ